MSKTIRIWPRNPSGRIGSGSDDGGKPFAVVELDAETTVHVGSLEAADALVKAATDARDALTAAVLAPAFLAGMAATAGEPS